MLEEVKMKLCIPVGRNVGQESPVFGHFGSAPLFAVHETTSGQTRFIPNGTQNHDHGSCDPMRTLGDEAIDALIVGGIGARAVARLQERGIKVYRGDAGTLQDLVVRYEAGALDEISIDGACTQHGGCEH